jgi:hypothetical protein
MRRAAEKRARRSKDTDVSQSQVRSLCPIKRAPMPRHTTGRKRQASPQWRTVPDVQWHRTLFQPASFTARRQTSFWSDLLSEHFTPSICDRSRNPILRHAGAWRHGRFAGWNRVFLLRATTTLWLTARAMGLRCLRLNARQLCRKACPHCPREGQVKHHQDGKKYSHRD